MWWHQYGSLTLNPGKPMLSCTWSMRAVLKHWAHLPSIFLSCWTTPLWQTLLPFWLSSGSLFQKIVETQYFKKKYLPITSVLANFNYFLTYSKTDLRSSRTLAEVKNVMRIDHLLSTGMNSQLITLVEFDVVTKQNIDKVVDWCMQFIIPVPVAEPAQ